MKEIRTILLATDFSGASRKAVDPAKMLARKFGAKIILVHVGEFVFFGEHFFTVDLVPIQREANAQARQELERFAAEHLGPDLNVELASPLGVAHIEIVKLAKERSVDLIVMSAHGRAFISHAIMGSTTERVVRQAPCPVLVIRDSGVD